MINKKMIQYLFFILLLVIYYLLFIIYTICEGYEGMFRDLDDAEEAFNAVAEKEEELKIIVTKGRVLTPEIISQEIDENEENEKIEKGKIE